MCVGQQVAIANDDLIEEPKYTSIDNCTCFQVNASLSHEVLDTKVASSMRYITSKVSKLIYNSS